ncbi:hypothetical protein B0H15DRAFT_951663 [Mycena belliarum]|uniref:Uncharacterized protein n=1 Tax=Mycena belliarum TaxID=1033014 RepID=A0AAD6U0A1_9AGAR|nr:hypothetical protein B0H15DRAFT_951663 [Mycena belliae]
MPPKRTRQSSTAPDEPTKRTRIDTTRSEPLSPVTDMSDTEPGAAADTTCGSVLSDAVPAACAASTVQDDETSTAATVTVTTVAPPVSDLTESAAVAALRRLGVEPGAVVGADAKTLNAILSTLLQAKVDGVASISTAKSLDSAAEVITPSITAEIAGVASAAHVEVNVVEPDKSEALKVLTDMGVTASRVAHWSATEMKRLSVVLGWADTDNNIYSITKVPTNKDWGIAAPFNDTSNVLCLEGTSKEVTIWIAGEVSAQYFFDNEGYPAQRPGFAVQPMDDHVADLCKTQLHELSMPTGSSKVAEQMGPGQVKASRWMNERGKKGQPSKTFEFKAVYDARKYLRDKCLLQQLSVGQLQLHDIVVMELRIQRYPVREDGPADATKGKRRAMDKWQAYYDLQAIYKFKDAAGAVVPKASVAVFEI